ncbi:MAG: alkaline phosphatase family protein [Polyangiaceae bacterium]
MSKRTTYLALLASLIVVATTIGVGLLTIMSGRTAAPFSPGAPASTKLSDHVLLVVVDGLRYDYATDESKAPNFARRMREHAHAEVTASRVTMTSAAIFSFGTGRRGDFSHVVLNLHAKNMGFNSIVANVRSAGLRTGLVGDQTWRQAYDPFDSEYLDDKDVSIETDNSVEMLDAASRMLTAEPRPSFMVAHVISPDHQGHAYGTASSKYLSFLKVFDADLEKFLQQVPPDTTVFVVSDHGATDTGAHGTDIANVRRTPLFAFGPGIAKSREGLKYEQVDVAPTMAAVLGVPGPAHGRGTVASELLDVPAERAAEIRCADVARLPGLSRAEGRPDVAAELDRQLQPCASNNVSAKSEAALLAARHYDAEVDRGQDDSSRSVMLLAAIVLVVLMLSVTPLLASIAEKKGGFAQPLAFVAPVLLGLIIVVLTREVEKVTPPFHNVIRAVLFVGGNAALLLGAVRPSLGARAFTAWPLLCATLFPGAIAWSYPPNAQPEALVSLLLGGGLWAWLARRGSVPEGWTKRFVMLVLGSLCLVVFGIVQDGPIRQELAAKLVYRGGMLVLAALWLWLGFRDRDPAPRRSDLVIAIVVSIGALLLRPVVGSLAAQLIMIGGPIFTLALLRQQRWTLALACLLASYAMVSRSIELLAVLGALIAAEGAGSLIRDAVSTERNPTPESPVAHPLWSACVSALVLFGIGFLLRMGLQAGLDFAGMDLGAGVWGDEQPSQLRIGLCITWKYIVTALLVLVCFLRELPTQLRRDVLVVSLLAWVGRAAVHSCVLLYCRASFWTSLRVLSDLAPVLLTGLIVMAMLAREAWVTGSTPERAAGSRTTPFAPLRSRYAGSSPNTPRPSHPSW